MKCEICGRDNIKPVGFSAHLKRHNYTSKQYYDYKNEILFNFTILYERNDDN